MRIVTTGIVAGCVAVAFGCGSRQAKLRPKATACAKATSDKRTQSSVCKVGIVTLELVNDSQLELAKTSLHIDGKRIKPGSVELDSGEHTLDTELRLSGRPWDGTKKPKPRATRNARGSLRFATAPGCRLTIRVHAQDPPAPKLAAQVRFTQSLRCNNGFRAEGSIPKPQPLPALPRIAVAPLRHWGAQCIQRTNAAQRYLDLAVSAISQLKGHVVTSCLHEKQRRIRELRDMIRTSVNFVKRPTRAELHQDARMTEIACLRVLDLQAAAGKCI